MNSTRNSQRTTPTTFRSTRRPFLSRPRRLRQRLVVLQLSLRLLRCRSHPPSRCRKSLHLSYRNSHSNSLLRVCGSSPDRASGETVSKAIPIAGQSLLADPLQKPPSSCFPGPQRKLQCQFQSSRRKHMRRDPPPHSGRTEAPPGLPLSRRLHGLRRNRRLRHRPRHLRRLSPRSRSSTSCWISPSAKT